jgi:hypothetical protein
MNQKENCLSIYFSSLINRYSCFLSFNYKKKEQKIICDRFVFLFANINKKNLFLLLIDFLLD